MAGNIEDLKVKVGLKYSDPQKEYEFLDKLGEGYVSLIWISSASYLFYAMLVTNVRFTLLQCPKPAFLSRCCPHVPFPLRLALMALCFMLDISQLIRCMQSNKCPWKTTFQTC